MSKIAYRERSHARGIGAKLHQRERVHRDSEAETVEQREERLRVRRIKDGARRAAQTV